MESFEYGRISGALADDSIVRGQLRRWLVLREADHRDYRRADFIRCRSPFHIELEVAIGRIQHAQCVVAKPI